MPDPDLPDVKALWDSRARDADTPEDQVTHRDVWQRWLEIALISRCLRPRDRVLDVGCGNGYTTRQIAPLVAEVLGIDYSAEMIERARAAMEDAAETRSRLAFFVHDVLELASSAYGMFDVVISERCLINLSSWDAQKVAIRNLAGVLRPGGLLVLVEGDSAGRSRLNALRERMGLPRMPRVWHNLDFEPETTLAYLGEFFTLQERRDFGTYDLISRVVHPLLVAPVEPRYDAKINEIAARVSLEREDPSGSSRVMFWVLKRR
jgi:SAM-dependent methyltransferase